MELHYDITRQREVERLLGEREAQLAESENRYRQVFDFVPFALYVHDGETILQANQKAAEI